MYLRPSNTSEILVRALKDPYSGVRQVAARELVKFGDINAVPSLVGCLGDVSEYVRASAAEALGSIGDTRVMSELRKALDDPEELVRESAYQAVSRLEALSKYCAERSEPLKDGTVTPNIIVQGDVLFPGAASASSGEGVALARGGSPGNTTGMRCVQCGEELNLPANARFCPFCGERM